MIFPLEVTYTIRFVLQISFSLLFFTLGVISFRSYLRDRGLGSLLIALLFFTVGLNQLVHSSIGPLNLFLDSYQDIWEKYFRDAVNISLLLAVSVAICVLASRGNVKLTESLRLLSTSDTSLYDQLKQVQQRNEILERLLQDGREFVYATAHDLRAPLRSIGGFSALLAEGAESPPDPLYLEQIDIATNKMLALIDGLAYLNKAESEQLPSSQVDLNGLVTDVIEIFEQHLTDKGVSVNVEILPTVNGVEARLRQVFQNFVGNAIKFGANKIDIFSHLDADGKILVIGVRDNGIGIAPQYHQKIFETFQRLNNEEHYPGAGIGLAIVKKIITQHGGQVWVESEPGKGSTFYFSIPIIL